MGHSKKIVSCLRFKYFYENSYFLIGGNSFVIYGFIHFLITESLCYLTNKKVGFD